jgi:hypothetical protein
MLPQQPRYLPLKRSHTSFLEDSIDQFPLSPAPKRYCPESVNSFGTQWVESSSELDCRSNTLISELESYRGRHCRSDTLLGHSDSEIIPRRLAKSVGAEPNMAFVRDNDGFIVPPTPPNHTRFETIRGLTRSIHRLLFTPNRLGNRILLLLPVVQADPLGNWLITHYTGLRTWLRMIFTCALTARSSPNTLAAWLIT